MKGTKPITEFQSADYQQGYAVGREDEIYLQQQKICKYCIFWKSANKINGLCSNKKLQRVIDPPIMTSRKDFGCTHWERRL